MLQIPGNTRIFLHKGATDLRKGFETLSFLVQESFDMDLQSGALFIFLNRVRDRMKVLYWDVDGLAIWYKRLEKGTFKASIFKNQSMTRQEFLLMLEGITPKRIQKRFRV
jgi:transposase